MNDEDDIRADGYLLFRNPPDKFGELSYQIWKRQQRVPLTQHPLPQAKETGHDTH